MQGTIHGTIMWPPRSPRSHGLCNPGSVVPWRAFFSATTGDPRNMQIWHCSLYLSILTHPVSEAMLSKVGISLVCHLLIFGILFETLVWISSAQFRLANPSLFDTLHPTVWATLTKRDHIDLGDSLPPLTYVTSKAQCFMIWIPGRLNA